MIKDKAFFCSWSGGKDSCLSLHKGIQEGGIPKLLLTMMTESGTRSRSHGLELSILQAQAQSLGLPLAVGSASWNEYERVFIDALKEVGKQGVEAGVFGDIDIEDHRAWVTRVCQSASLSAYHPLWSEPHSQVLKDFIEAGFRAHIVSLKDGVLGPEMLGRVLDWSLVQELEQLGVDPCGESGEFHTVVTDGPLFSYPVPIEMKEKVLRDGYWFLDLKVAKS